MKYVLISLVTIAVMLIVFSIIPASVLLMPVNFFALVLFSGFMVFLGSLTYNCSYDPSDPKTLTTEGKLLVWHPYTLCTLVIWTYFYGSTVLLLAFAGILGLFSFLVLYRIVTKELKKRPLAYFATAFSTCAIILAALVYQYPK